MLGVNPVQHLLASAHALSTLPAASQQILTGQEFFPALISAPFHQGLIVVFIAAALAVGGGGASRLAALAAATSRRSPDPAHGRPRLAPPRDTRPRLARYPRPR